MSSSERCAHCLLDMEPQNAIVDEQDGERLYFCCQGCRGIYHLLRSEGFDSFYRRRVDYQPGPPDEQFELSSALYAPFVRSMDDGSCRIDLSLSGIRCAACIWLIENYLQQHPGLIGIRVNYATHRARLEWDPQQTDILAIAERILAIGYQPLPYQHSEYEDRLRRERRDLLLRFGTAALFSMQVMLYTVALYAGYFQGMEEPVKRALQIIAWALATPVMFYSAWPFARSSWAGLRRGHFTMDLLIFTGSFSAYAYSVLAIFRGGEVFFETSTMIITLILLGRLIETGARNNAAAAVAGLMRLQPREARRRVQDAQGQVRTEVTAIDQIVVGDLIEVPPGAQIPLDGRVEQGESEVDESMLTGESRPQYKQPGCEVIGGTRNAQGFLQVRVLRIGDDSLLAGIIRTVEEAQTRKAPVQRVADRVVGWFVPLILLIALLCCAGWLLLGASAVDALMHAISVLIIACPCALGLATPLAVLVSSTSMSQSGVMVKGGDVIESAARVRNLLFDKTGTLTRGQLQVQLVETPWLAKEDFRRFAASLEYASEHSLGRAIAAMVPNAQPVEQFRAHPGKGVSGRYDGMAACAGTPGMLAEQGVRLPVHWRDRWEALEAQGHTTLGFALGGEFAGLIALRDELRSEAESALQKLHALCSRIGMLTGDAASVAASIARQAGIDEDLIQARVQPVGKSELVRQWQRYHGSVAMVGDGINDAPALIEADLGIAMGRATDIALESADIVLIRSDLRLIPHLLQASRASLRVIHQNLFWAFFYNLLALPLAIFGLIHPIVSAAAMACSSLLVVLNSLRLRRWSQVS